MVVVPPTSNKIFLKFKPYATGLRQCDLLELNRSSYYFKPKGLDLEDYAIMRKMDEIFTEHPYYGTRRMLYVLRSEGYSIGRKRVRRYYEILGIEAIYPKMNLSKRNQAHKVYPYLLRGLEVQPIVSF